jgi:multiple sugar transport system permease protein
VKNHESDHPRTGATRIPRRITPHLIALAGAGLTLLPVIWMVGASFMETGEANSVPPPLWPERPTLRQYLSLFTRLDMARHFFNSAFVAVSTTVLSVLINGMAGYAFGKLHFRGRGGIFRTLVTGLVVPAQIGMLPLFLLLRELGLVNTYAGLMIPYLASIFGIFLVRQYVESVPDELLDAARIDGAGEMRIFSTVVFPIIRPILVTLATFTFLGVWNDFMWPLIILTDSSMQTLPVALANLSGEHVLDTELMMAGAVITVPPALLVFLAFQRTYVRGITAGGVKG